MVKKSRSRKMKGGDCYGGMKGGAEKCNVLGGRRRSRRRRMRGGMYGATGGVIGPGALEYGGAYTGNVDPNTGGALPDPTSGGDYVGVGGRRRRTRKTRKGGKKSRRTRKMRGGATPGMVSAMKAGYGFDGTGYGGLSNVVPAPTSGGNAF